MKINLKINKLIYFSRLPQTFVYGNLVRNAKQFLMSSSKIYTPVVRNSDKKTCESQNAKNQCWGEITTQKIYLKNFYKPTNQILFTCYRKRIFYTLARATLFLPFPHAIFIM